ncbi:HlyD family secretion protein [Vibrio sp. JC009]|uniref:efflux RND transporter periplasmic adaptor subunit n=1 Tax=Vibrio sp. JC009 TaxID=2912314 RepID=UPI0023B05991|nr:HlyD family secretion protein [Vibrio sp. JC009]WED22159.1 HlyD family secretion protein [Vibrio sp. JC009]
MKINRSLLFFPALAVGVVALVLAVKMRPDLPVKPAVSKARLVETMSMEKQELAPVVVGYGKVAPKYEWKAIAEVSGKVVYRNPALEKGRVLPAGTEIIRIDPLDYELVLVQAEADLKSSETQLARLDLEESNLKSTLKIEKNRLVISKKELDRKVNLKKKGLTSQSDVDQQQQSYLSQQKLVKELENQLSLYPDERKVSQAQVAVNESRVAEAQRSLEKTSVVLPQQLRISSVDIEENQVVNLQQTMVEAHRVDVMEVEAQLSIHDMRLIASSLDSFVRDKSSVPDPAMNSMKASIELSSGNLKASWPAKVSRISDSVDANQATAGVILEIEQDYTGLTPENVPPLVTGMFVKADIVGKASSDWVIPERALHGDRVYIKGADNKLEIRKVEVIYRRDNQVVIKGSFKDGEKLILNDLLPAIEGMLLREASDVAEDAA